MKKTLIILLSLVSYGAVAQFTCDNGIAGSYPCNGYDLQSTFTLNQLNAGSGNDSWGWTDPDNGDEYAIIGLNNGTAFIDISDPINPIYLGKLPTHTSNSSWRDIKVYENHAFVVSEANGHGMQVFDLTRLRSVANPPETFSEDAHYDEFGSAHNIIINEDSGYAYAVGTSSYSGGPHFIDIQNPTNPIAAGGFSDADYSHDAQVIIYNGPDTDYTGREIYIGSNEDNVTIVDVTDKNNPLEISSISYSNAFYTHQGWLTEDQRYFITGDELDELNIGIDTRTIIFDFEDLDSPQFHFEFFGNTSGIDHNGYVVGDKYYMANYRAGIRILDISDIANQNISEEGYFDTYTSSNSAAFDGAWNVYPFFASGNIVISDINSGFFLVKDSNSGPPQTDDIGVTAITDPNSGVLGATEDIVVTIENFGSSDITNPQVQYILDGGAAIVENYVGTITSGSTESYTFTAQGDLSAAGNHTIVARTNLAGDSNPANDATTKTVLSTIVYCEPSGDCSLGSGFTNVTVSELDHDSGCEGYADFTSEVATLGTGASYDFTVTTGYGDQYIRAWIDFNDDGTFDTSETVVPNFIIAPGQAAGTYTETVTLTIPAGVPSGMQHRMRVKANWQAPVPDDACEATQFGETEDYTADIIYIDNIDPTAICQNITVQLNFSGAVVIIGNFIDGGSTDNVGIVSYTVVPNTFNCSNVGANTVTLLVADAAGNTDTCTAIVTVEDNMNPSVIGQNTTGNLNGTGSVTIPVSNVDIGSSDNCGIANLSLTPNTFTSIGTYPAVLAGTDPSGNSGIANVTITVIDTVDSLDPTAVCQDITVQLNNSGTVVINGNSIDGGSTDNIGIVSYTAVPNTFNCSDIGTNAVTLLVTDAAGNSDTCIAVVTVEDNVDPNVIGQNATGNLNGTGSVTVPVSSVDTGSTDNCSLANLSLTPNTFTSVGNYVAALEGTDPSGNSDFVVVVITIIDDILNTLEPEFTDFLMYPNPANTTITIDGGEHTLITRLQIVDMTGKQIISRETEQPTQKFSLDISRLASSIYFISITDSNGKRVMKKLIKE